MSMKTTAILAGTSAILAIGGFGCNAMSRPVPVIHRPLPSPDEVVAPAPALSDADRDEQVAYAGPGGVASGSAAPAAQERVAVPTEWRELRGTGGRIYTIQPADTLSEIAMRELDTMHNLPLLMLANRRLDRPEMVRRGESVVVPGPAYFAAPFLRTGEQAVGQKVLRYREDPREGVVGVQLEDGSGQGGRDRFVAVEAKGGMARMVFDSTGLLPAAPAGCAESAWAWRALDLDDDGGLDLVASRKVEPGGVLQACVFQSTDRGHRRHVLTEQSLRGEYDGRRVSYRRSTLSIRGAADAGGWSDELRYRWVGDRFEVTRQ